MRRLGTAGWPQGLPPDVATAGTSFNRLGISLNAAGRAGLPLGASGSPMTAPHARDVQGCHLPILKLQAQDKPWEGMKAPPLVSENTFLF